MRKRLWVTATIIWSFVVVFYAFAVHSAETAGSGGSATTKSPDGSSAAVKSPEQLQGYPIVAPFKENFNKCTGKANMGTNCKFEDLGIMGDASHQARRSCHNVGEAIDVGYIECAGQKIQPSDKKYEEFVKCFADDTNGVTNDIFHKKAGQNTIQKSDHVKHVHIQLKNCRMVTGSGGGAKTASAGSSKGGA